MDLILVLLILVLLFGGGAGGLYYGWGAPQYGPLTLALIVLICVLLLRRRGSDW